MKTAVMSAPPLVADDSYSGNSSSAAVESAIDAYATRVLQTKSPADAFIDTSLGPYVTSLLRCAEIHTKDDVTGLAEYESLLELLEDQCNMKSDAASQALRTIANAVCTGVVPHETSKGDVSIGLYSGAGLDSFQTIKASAPEVQAGSLGMTLYDQPPIDPYTPTSAGGPSPLKPDNLIPIDLLGVLDDPSPYLSRHRGKTCVIVEEPAREEEIGPDKEAFPPLGATVAAPSKKSARAKKGSKSQPNKELAAALFHPARPRQNSIEREDSPTLGPAVPKTNPSTASQNRYFQQQWDSCVEILLSMNPELGEEAAVEAGLMANTDFNIAQYLVDAAISAPPICRHMLHDGCYRSDCQFSHDVEGHTCLFWLRGRCGKGASCKFLHGFNRKLLDGIQMTDPNIPSGRSDPVPIVDNNGSAYMSTQRHYQSQADGYSAFSLPSRSFENPYTFGANKLASSWQPHSLTNSLASSSVSSGDSKSGGGTSSFASIASKGYGSSTFASTQDVAGTSSSATVQTVRIPQDLWNPNENRDASVFHIADPLERYQKVAASVKRNDVIDLHFQSTKTFADVLNSILRRKLSELGEVWIVTGTGHHVGAKTHQKGGGILERAVTQWLTDEGFNFSRGRDRNGLGGAVLVRR